MIRFKIFRGQKMASYSIIDWSSKCEVERGRNLIYMGQYYTAVRQKD